jgi:site-specific recombinase XerD
MHEIATRAGLVGVSTHTLRHTFASRMLAAGVDVRLLAPLLGHEDVTVTLRTYSHLLPNHQDRARAAIELASPLGVPSGISLAVQNN